MIHPERIQVLNRAQRRTGAYVLYWMQQAQRTACNHALEYAIGEANAMQLPVLVAFGLTPAFPEARKSHYRFMLEGLREVRDSLASRGIRFVVRLGSPDTVAIELAASAAVLVTDRGYLRLQKQWRRRVAEAVACPVVQVETDVVVPVEAASGKEEYSAATLRRKIHPLLETYLTGIPETRSRHKGADLQVGGIELDDIDAVLARVAGSDGASATTAPAAQHGGTTAAKTRLRAFLDEQLEHYADRRSDPARDYGSAMSAYLHFGQISPLDIALAVRGATSVPPASREAYLEELIIRRELAMNFVHYNSAYDTFEALPQWALDTMAEHAQDPRPYVYEPDQLEQAATHDPYWNAAQIEMLLTGRMHNYMRMYWGKKILEWSDTPEHAFATALYLNNSYEMDGRDPNGFAGVAWCFGKHDRGWPERPIFGKVRYMNANGLCRKFDMPAYIVRIRALAKEHDMDSGGLD